MPIPQPHKGESQSDYVGRCMAHPGMQEYEQDQRAGVCYSTWREHDKGEQQARSGTGIVAATSANAAAERHARSLINAGDFDATSPWAFSAEDGDKLLGSAGNDWAEYGLWHLGEDAAADADTKAHWKYPVGKSGKVYGAALRAIRSRASGQDASAVFAAAGRLLDVLNMKAGDTASATAGRLSIVSRAPASRAAAEGYRMVRGQVAEDAGEIYLYGLIGGGGLFDLGGITANQFRKDLQALGGGLQTIDLHIFSDGGDVFEAKEIYMMLLRHQATINVYIDSLAASAAGLIAMAGDRIEIAEGGFFMLHEPSGAAFGDAVEMRKTASLLDSASETMVGVYAARSRLPPDKVKAMMEAETWLTGPEAVAAGFADATMANKSIVACCRHPSPFKYKHMPAALRPNRALAVAEMAGLAAS